MRNLINFIWSHHFTVLFLLLEIFAFALLVQNNNFHRAGFYNFTAGIAGSFYDATNQVSDYMKLKDKNDLLVEENARLREALKQSLYPAKKTKTKQVDSLYMQQYEYVGAKVINNSVTTNDNYLLLNAGTLDGIEPGMGVIGSQGIVGIIIRVSEHYAVAMSVLHGSQEITCVLKKDQYSGPLKWEGFDPEIATLSNIPNHVEISQGDSVITMGSSTIFPAGIPVGTIESFENKPSEGFYEINVRLATNFRKLHYAYIVKNLFKLEQQNIEEGLNLE